MIGGKGIGIYGIPGGLPLIIRFSPGRSSGINPALRRGTLVLVIQDYSFHHSFLDHALAFPKYYIYFISPSRMGALDYIALFKG
jgi:hypothetical protein